MIGIGVFGATGKVGKLLVNEILTSHKCQLSSVFVRNELHYDVPSSTLITKNMDHFVESSQVIIDFSSPEATHNLLNVALKQPKALVIGTTGLDSQNMDLLKKASEIMPILYATNMSLGVAILDKISSFVSAQLRHFDIEISEIHHRYKKDSPSGTALSLASSVSSARGLNESNYIYSREELREPRGHDDISIVSMRGGDIVGRHTVGFYGDGEYLELTHCATSRATFAKGALNAAIWLSNKNPGLYKIQDMFNLN